MLNIKKSSNKWLTLSILLSLWLNSLIPFFSSASLLSSVNNGQNGDAVLICTATGLKWVSQSAIMSTGKFVFLDIDSENLEHPSLEQTTCPLVLLADQASDHDITTVIPFVHVNNFTALYTILTLHPPLFNYYVAHPSRAPPYFS